MRIDPACLEDGKDMAQCPVCRMVLNQPTVGCPEGHAFCRICYVESLSRRKNCPMCNHNTDESKLVRCRPLEDLIGQLWVRCKHGLEDGTEPESQRSKLEPLGSMGTDDVRKELEQRGLNSKGRRVKLVALLKEHRQHHTGQGAAHLCSWRGRVCELAGHLAERCGHETVECPNSATGCMESVLRKDAARHASKTCEYRQSRCSHCSALFVTRDLPAHEGSCPEAQIECPNAGCGENVARRSMVEHRWGCGREEVACPCPGCEERMARSEVEAHVEASEAVHLRSAWGAVAEMEEKVDELDEMFAEQEQTIKGQRKTIKEQERLLVEQKGEIAVLRKEGEKVGKDLSSLFSLLQKRIGELAEAIKAKTGVVAGLERRAEALTHVFTWSTDSAWSNKASVSCTFTGGVRGQCVSFKRADTHWMCFKLEEGPAACTMHFKCSILDKEDKVHRGVSELDSEDFKKPPSEIRPVLSGASFSLSEDDTAAAVRTLNPRP